MYPPNEPADPEHPQTPEPDHETPRADEGVVGAVRKDRLRAALFGDEVEPRHIGRYRVIGTLGRGGMGVVLEAYDDALERPIALKLLHRDLSPLDQQRLLREARALARLSHPNVVQVHEVGEQPQPFIAMELVRGRTLARWQRSRPSVRACVEAYLQAGRGLAAVHMQRLVHRDFKPDNCIIDDEGRVRVMDFGLVRSVDKATTTDGQLAATAGTRTTDELVPALTQTGALLGTLAYMAPEQLAGEEADARSDQFAFCVSLYEALHGQRPFRGRTATALAAAIEAGELPPPPRGTRIPAALRRILRQGLQAQPDQRWPSMDALLQALERVVQPRWRTRLAALALVGGLGLSGLAVWYEVDTRKACAGASEQLAPVGNPERREQVRRGLLDSGLPYAEDAWAGVEPRLDAYARAWTEAWTDSCEAARIRKDQPEVVTARRTACLHQRRVALREAVEVLASGEAAAVERSVALAVSLPSLDRCADVPALLALLPPPEDPEVRARVQEVRDALDHANALRIAGRYAASLDVLEGVTGSSEALGYAPLGAEIAHRRAWALYGAGRQDEAIAAFERSYTEAIAHGHDPVAAEAAIMLSFIVGSTKAEHALGLQWGLTAEALARRPAAEPGADGMALANIAAVHMRHGEFELARAKYAEAVRRQEALFGPDDVRLAYAVNGLGFAYTALERYEEAGEAHQRALALRRDNLGAHHPYVAMSLNNLGIVDYHLDRFDQSEDHFRQALRIKEQILGPEHPELISSLANLGSMAYQRRDYDEALARFGRAAAILERTRGPDDPLMGELRQGVGLVHLDRKQYDEAAAALEQGLQIRERALGPEHPELVEPLTTLGVLALEQTDLPTAARYLDRALAIADKSKAEDSTSRTDLLVVQARLRAAQGNGAEAARLAQLALTLKAKTNEPVFKQGEARLALARAAAALGDDDRSTRLTEQVLESLAERTDPRAARTRQQAQQWLEQLRRRRDPPPR